MDFNSIIYPNQQDLQPITEGKIEISPITLRLSEHLLNADKIKGFAHETPSKTLEASIKALHKALVSDKDIQDRLAEIAKNQFTSPFHQCRQLCDMQLYLTLLNNHAQSSDLTKEELDSLKLLVDKVKEASSTLTEAITPAWKTDVNKIEKIIKESINKENPIPFTPSSLNTHKGTALDDNTFANIHAEALIKGSLFEGNADIKVLGYLDKYLEANQNHYEEVKEYPSLLKMVRDAYALAVAGKIDTPPSPDPYEFEREFPNRCKKFQSALSEIVTKLSPGEKTLAPLGWLKHSMKLGIEREEGGTLRVVIYNTGNGLNDFHASLRDKGEQLYQPFIEIRGVEEKRLLDPDFTQSLFEILVVNSHPGEAGNTEYSAHDVYGVIMNSLGGTIITCQGDREKFMPDQKSGTCTWASLLAVFHSNLPLKDYHSIVHDITFDSLCAYFQSVKGDLSTKEASRHLLQHALTRCAQSTLDAFHNEAISLTRLQEVHATLNDLQQMLLNAEGSVFYSKLSQKELLFTGIEPLVPRFLSVEPWEFSPPETSKPLELAKAKGSTSQPPIPFEWEWMDDSKTIVDGLGKLVTHISQCLENGDGKIALDSLENFFKLQAQEGKEAVWRKVPSEQRAAALVHFADLGELLFTASSARSKNKRSYITDAFYLMALSLITSSDNMKIEIENEFNNLNYQNFKYAVAASLDYGALTQDQNLYLPEERYLRQRALELLAPYQNNKLNEHFTPSCHFKSDNSITKPLPQSNFYQYELKYIDGLLDKDPTLLEKLKEKYPNTDLGSRANQVVLAFCDWYGEILPAEFCAQRRLDMITKELLNGNILVRQEKSTFKFKIEESKNEFHCKSDCSYYQDPLGQRDFQYEKLFKELVSVREKQNRNTIYDSESDVMLRKLDEWQQNLQLILTQGDFNDKEQHLEQQFIKTISYFTEHREQLTDHDMRMLCRLLFFEGNYLELILEKNPALGELLNQFTRRGFQYFTARGNTEAATFFIEIGKTFQAIALFKNCPVEFPDFRKLLLDLLLRENVSPADKTLIYSQLAAGYESHPPAEFTSEDASLLLTSLMHDKVYQANKATDYTRGQMDCAFSRWKEQIQFHLHSEMGSKICHAIAKAVDPLANEQPWDCKSYYPICVSKDGIYVLDAEKLEFRKSNNVLTGIPIDLFDDVDVKKLFSRRNYPTQIVKSGCYEFIDERGIQTQIEKTFNYDTRRWNTKLRQKLDDGRWYQLTNKWELSGTFLRQPEDFLKLCDNNSLWVPCDEGAPSHILVRVLNLKTTHTIDLKKFKALEAPLDLSEQQEVFQFLTKDQPGTEAEEKIRKEIFALDKHLYRLLKGLELKEEEIDVFEKLYDKYHPPFDAANWKLKREKSEKAKQEKINDYLEKIDAPQSLNFALQKLLSFKELIDIKNRRSNVRAENLFVIDACTKNSEANTPLSMVDLLHAPSSPLKTLFEKGMLWKDREGNLKELELPSLGLFFSMEKGKDDILRAFSADHPGFFLASNQQYRGLEIVPGAIVLENKEGKRKLILPYGKIELDRTGSLKSSLKEIRIEENASKRTISFDLDNTSRPIASHKEQQLYLAGILFAQKKYSQVQSLLRSSFSHVLPYNAQEIALLEQIAYVAKDSLDFSPHAAAITFTALSLLPPPKQQTRVNLADWQKEAKSKQLMSWIEQYEPYKQQLTVIPDLHLTIEEEKQALRYLILAVAIDKSEKALGLVMAIVKYLHQLEHPDMTENVKLPSIQESKKKKSAFFFSSLCSKVNDFSYINKPMNKALITRPLTFQNDFYKWYELALKDPLKLEIILSGAEQEKTAPQELITLLRNVGRASRDSSRIDSDFPPSVADVMYLISKKNEKAFVQLLKQAEEFEKEWVREKEAENLAVPILSGIVPGRHPQKKEAQSIGRRSIITSTSSIPEINQRKALLTEVQFKAFVEVENQGLILTQDQITQLQKAVTSGGIEEQPGEAAELADHIGNYWNLSVHSNKWHQLPPEQPSKVQEALSDSESEIKKKESPNLSEIKTFLLVSQSEMGKHLGLLSQELLAFANDLPSTMQEALLYETEKMGHVRQDITLNDLTLFAARSRIFTLTGKNPKLADKEKELLEKCLHYLDVKAQQQQLNRALMHLNSLEELTPILETSQDAQNRYERASEMCYRELTRVPPYKIREHPELLVFEVLEDIGLHDWQYTDLMRMLQPTKGENTNIIIEKVMGAGKTKVYLPILALSKADGEHLPIIVVHSSQYETVAQAMQIKSGQLFAQVAHTLNFNRDSDTSAAALQKILDECEEVRKNGHFLVVTDKTMHSLSLAFDQLWDNYLGNEKPDSSLPKRIEIMREILSLFKEKGKAVFDEADLLLNCRFEVVYSMGEAQPIATAHADIVADLYKSIEPHLTQLSPFTKESYEKKKPELIKSFVQEVVPKMAPQCDLDKISDYLSGGKSGADYVDILPKNTRDLLAIALYEFKELLPIVLDRRCGEHFGYSDKPDKILPVPYLASGVPSPTAEFSFPYALLDYTVQTLKADGVSRHLLKQLITNMKNRAAKEQKADSSLSLQDTNGYKEFLELCGNKISIPFLSINDNDIDLLARMYKENPPDIYQFAKKYLFPAVTLHNRKLTSTPYTLANLFGELQGFTGTPWNSKTYPKQLQTLRDINSAGKTQGLIWENSQKVYPPLKGNIEEIMSKIAEIQNKGGYHAFIDVGATFNGIDNQTVAEAFLKKLPQTIKGVLFFKNNRPVVLERNKEPYPFEQCGLNKEQLYIFYDQYHTTGTDFKIADKSLLSVGKNNKMRDLEQGYMRDRQAELGRRVEFVLTDETSQYIRKELKLKEDEAIGTAEILRLTEINQERELKDQLLMASFGRIKETVNQHLRALLINPKIPPEKIKKKSEQIQKLIGDLLEDSPYDQFGMFPQTLPAEKFFGKIINQTLKKMEVLFTDKDLFQAAPSKEEVTKELWKCIDLDLLPKELSAAAEKAPEQLVEMQSQQQVQQERMALVHKELLTDTEPPNPSGTTHWNWDTRLNTSQSSFYQLMTPEELDKHKLPAMDKSSSKWTPITNGQPPFMSLKDIFEKDPVLEEFKDVFDIEVSYNFLPIRGTAREGNELVEVRNRPLRKSQLQVKNMLICKDKEGNVQLRLLSQADAGFFFRKMGDERALTKEKEIDATLYHIVLGPIQNNIKEVFAAEDVTLDTAMRKKVVQAKFYNGESIYSEAERKLLEDWILAKDPEKMERLFCQYILVFKDDKKTEYPGSTLSNIFNKLNKKALS